LIVPDLLSGPKPSARTPAAVAGGAVEPVRNVTVDLTTNKATTAEDPASAAAYTPPPASPPGGSSSAGPAGDGARAGLQPAASNADSARGAQQPTITTLKAQQPGKSAETASENEASPANRPPGAGAQRDAGTADGPHHSWTVQIGSFASRANAEKQLRHLKTHDSSVYVSAIGKGSTLRYRVRAGPFADRDAAERAMAKLKKEGQSASLVPP
jgi:DedD protein